MCYAGGASPARRQGRQNAAVFLNAAMGRMRAGKLRQGQPATIAEFTHIADQHRAAGQLGKQDVEFGGKADGLRFRPATGLILKRDMGIKRKGLFVGQTGGKAGDHEVLGLGTQFEQVARLF